MLWIIKAGLFIVPFVPLYVSRVLFFPYITGKAFIFRIAVEIVFFLWVWLAIFNKEFRPRKSALLSAVTLFIIFVSLATIFGVNPVKSFWSNFERMEGLATYWHLFAYFLVISSVFQKKDWFIFFNLFVIAGLYENFYVLFQRLGYLASPQGGVRTDGTIGNPTYLAAYLIFILGFCLWLLINTNNKSAKYFYGFASFFTLLSIYFTASRGPTLALLISAVAAILLYLYLKPSLTAFDRLAKKAAVGFLLLLILIPVGLWLLRDTSLIKSSPSLSRLTSLSLKERTIMSRFSIWSMSFEGFKEHPVLGWGPDNYEIVFSKYFKPELWRQEPWFDRSHNIILDWLINAGFLGLLSYLAIFGSAVYLLWRNYKKGNLSLENSILFSAVFLAYFSQNLFVFDQIATYIGFFALLAYINGLGNSEAVEIAAGAKPKLSPNNLIVAGVLFVPLVFAIYFVNLKPLFANLNLIKALMAQSQDISLAYEKFDKALSYNTRLGAEEIRENLIRFSISAGGVPELNADFRDKILRRAIGEAQKTVVENPLDPRPRLFLGTIYQSVGLSKEAIAVFNQALELSPKKQQIYFEIADIYIQRRDFANAIKLLETALALDPEYDQARLNLAAAYILSSQQKKADDVLIAGFGTAEVPKPILVTIYSQIKDYNRLVGIWRAFVKHIPSDLEYRKNLSGAYLLAGDRASAVEVLEQAILDFPEFRTEGENLIKQIRSGR